ncbi:hypothetical protein Tco_0976549 [Tanacetum coccineum]|uniref:Reverse transcriptase domain-containing protein n=1 Tax=Tanacetum coccineum TaxID=301880 RepID=A0ABQ5EI01_9ASTR
MLQSSVGPNTRNTRNGVNGTPPRCSPSVETLMTEKKHPEKRTLRPRPVSKSSVRSTMMTSCRSSWKRHVRTRKGCNPRTRLWRHHKMAKIRSDSLSSGDRTRPRGTTKSGQALQTPRDRFTLENPSTVEILLSDKAGSRIRSTSRCRKSLTARPYSSQRDRTEIAPVMMATTRKYVKDPVEIHNIKQKDGETIEEFMERFKTETGRMKGAPECMRISGFMHGVNNPELTKRLNERVPKTMEEMMTTTVAFIRGETAAASKKKVHAPWKFTSVVKRHASDRSLSFKSLTFCEFHNDKGHSTDECVQLKKQIEELVRAGKLSQFVKGIRQEKDQQRPGKKDFPTKDKAAAIYMIQSWQRVTRQKVTQSFDRIREIVFPPLTANEGTEGPLVIEAEIGGHTVHRMYVDGGSSMEVLFEHCFNRLRPEIQSQMAPATTSLTGFSGETIWPIGQIRLLVTIGDAEHSTEAWMNFMIVGHHHHTTPSDMTGVPRSIAEHKLNIRKGYSPVCQKKRGQAPERAKAIQAEVQKLVEAGIMREVYYHDWLSNPVMVKKHDGSWRMCVDFTDLNKACPQDCYPLPEIDWKIESLCDYPFKCFMDAYKGYHQIQMAEEDEEKTAFHTP